MFIILLTHCFPFLSLQVKSVLYAIESNGAAISLQGLFAKRFFNCLDPKHRPPQNIKFMRIVRLLDRAVDREFLRLIADGVLELHTDFCSSSSDFYTNAERHESFGCIVANMMSNRYTFENGCQLFVSSKSLKDGALSQLLIETPELADLEFVLNFEQVSEMSRHRLFPLPF
jgi:hypothetical protein